MALVAATLGTGLGAMTPTSEEALAIDAMVTAWESYFSAAMAGPIPVVPGSLSAALATLRGALSGMSSANAGAGKIQSAISAFWATVAGSAGSIWPAAISATPPPGLGGIAGALSGIFAANTSGSIPLSTAANNIANAIHPLQLGGIAVFPPPPAGIGPQPIA